jgi:hypothetical protein
MLITTKSAIALILISVLAGCGTESTKNRSVLYCSKGPIKSMEFDFDQGTVMLGDVYAADQGYFVYKCRSEDKLEACFRGGALFFDTFRAKKVDNEFFSISVKRSNNNRMVTLEDAGALVKYQQNQSGFPDKIWIKFKQRNVDFDGIRCSKFMSDFRKFVGY